MTKGAEGPVAVLLACEALRADESRLVDLEDSRSAAVCVESCSFAAETCDSRACTRAYAVRPTVKRCCGLRTDSR